jgi:hypothetical protein
MMRPNRTEVLLLAILALVGQDFILQAFLTRFCRSEPAQAPIQNRRAG